MLLLVVSLNCPTSRLYPVRLGSSSLICRVVYVKESQESISENAPTTHSQNGNKINYTQPEENSPTQSYFHATFSLISRPFTATTEAV